MTRRPAALLLCLALVACTKDDPKPPARIDGVQEFGDPDHDHVKGPLTYPQDPPVGGPHNPVWLRCGVYDVPVPSNHAVHSMEHRAVWITYQPDLPQEDVDTLQRLQALKPAFVLISPYPGLTKAVVASAWGKQLRVDKADDPRLAEFVKTYAGATGGGVEPTATCMSGATLDQVRQIDASEASPTPAP